MNLQKTDKQKHDQSIWTTDAQIVVTNHLFESPLYSWWIVIIPLFDEGQIEGTLLDDVRGYLEGPFITQDDAWNMAMSIKKEFDESYGQDSAL